MELPLQLQAAIEKELASQPANRLAVSSAELSKSYRSGIPFHGGKHLRSSEDVIAYAAFRMPATYAAVYAVLRKVKMRSKYRSPKTLLDVGAGPGTAMWAASAIWPDIEAITLLERESSMIDLGKRLASCASVSSIQAAKWIKGDIIEPWNLPPHDVVIASYVLNELPQSVGKDFIDRLWESTGDMLIIIEPGTPSGFLRIKDARDKLVIKNAKTIAPCPHDHTCPMAEGDWCHFAQRVERSSLHRKVKGGELSYEDEKFSFLCMSRTDGEAIEGLVIRHPQIRKGHIQLELCTPEGLTSIVVTHKDKEGFRKARKLSWGSIL